MRGPGTRWVGGWIAATGFIASLHAQGVTSADIAAGLVDPARWPSVHGDYTGQRYSPAAQITPATASRLAPVWTFQTGVPGKFEATPIVQDGVLYFTGPQNNAWAIDARTGKQIWAYKRILPPGLKLCCGTVNRGFAAWHDRLYMATLDAHLVALDMNTGKLIWDVEVADFKLGYSNTSAPLVVNDALVVGMSGSEFATRGFLDAYHPATGVRLWRTWTVPAQGEPGADTWPPDVLERGGGAPWLTGTYDPELNTVYWGTGNPNPDYDGDSRPGDNLYTASLLALDPATGKVRWHYQFTPHDTHDWGANQVPVLATLTIGGEARRVIMQANRNGFFYVLDRRTGRVISGTPYVNQNWATGIGSDGRPQEIPGHAPTVEGTVTCPDWYGGTNFMSPSFEAASGTFFVTVRETCGRFIRRPTPDANVGDYTMGGTVARVGPRWGALRAIDAATGRPKWDARYDAPGWAGVLATAGGVVFTADHDGRFIVVDAINGKLLYTYQTGAIVYGPPTTYMIDARQFVVMPSGATVTAFALR